MRRAALSLVYRQAMEVGNPVDWSMLAWRLTARIRPIDQGDIPG